MHRRHQTFPLALLELIGMAKDIVSKDVDNNIILVRIHRQTVQLYAQLCWYLSCISAVMDTAKEKWGHI
jgi:hypothetical protein